MSTNRVNVPGLARLPAFSHAVVAGDLIFVAGQIGTQGEELALVGGGIGPQTRQVLRNIEAILAACGASLDDLVKVDVFLADMADFGAMNETYLEVLGDEPPARITVGRAELALGAAVEMSAIAARSGGAAR